MSPLFDLRSDRRRSARRGFDSSRNAVSGPLAYKPDVVFTQAFLPPFGEDPDAEFPRNKRATPAPEHGIRDQEQVKLAGLVPNATFQDVWQQQIGANVQ